MNDFFSAITPEAAGIPSAAFQRFLKHLEAVDLPLHSAIFIRHDAICMETYYRPYDANTVHRMFSITKSFVSLAIGLLEAEHKLSLDDPIVSFFPEKLPPEGAHPYLKMLTIRQMLAMTTCHDKTTYKHQGCTDWVGSFFTTPPSHIPGTNFSYDTSSTHVLAALVEKLTGMELLAYLRIKFLNELDFSPETAILKDPSGVSMGGSGLIARPIDIAKVIWLIAHDGRLHGKQLLPASYLRQARSRHSDPYGKSAVIEEMQGYGYQIWMTRHGGYALYGMGGQLACYFPEKDLFMITTADTQGRQGGTQLIYDAFWEEIYPQVQSQPLPENPAAQQELLAYCSSRVLPVVPCGLAKTQTSGSAGRQTDNPSDAEFPVCTASAAWIGQIYHADPNPCGITTFYVTLDQNARNGSLHYTNATGAHILLFGFGHNELQHFPDYNMKCAVSGAFRLENDLLIEAQIIDSAIGHIFFAIQFRGSEATMMIRKVEESLFLEYNGVFSAHADQAAS